MVGWLSQCQQRKQRTMQQSVMGMLVSPRTYGSLLDVESVSPRRMLIAFNGNPRTIISCCSPTSCSDKTEPVKFYSMLQDVIRQLPKHNCHHRWRHKRAGSEDTVGFCFHDKTNRNGNLLLDLTEECELVSISTKFQKNKGKLWTHTYPNGEKAYPHQQEVEKQCNGLPVLQHDVLCTVWS